MDDIRDIAVSPEVGTKSVHSLEDMEKLLEEYRQALKAQREAILFFEGDEHWRNIIRSVLIYRGYDVEVANNEKEALHFCEESRPKMVLVDLDAPEKAGWNLLKKAALEGVTAIAITKSENPATEAEAKDMGATEVITKPFVPVEFTTTIRKHWKKS